MITVEVIGLELHGYHGVNEDERSDGQRFLFDVWLEVPDAESDRIEDVVDYREVVSCVRELSDGHKFRLLEALSAAIADAVLARFPAVDRVKVRVRKPDVKLEAPVEHTAATAERARS